MFFKEALEVHSCERQVRPGSGPLLYLASAFDELTVRRGKLIPGGPNEEEKKGSIPGEQDPIGTSARESDPGRPKVRCSLRMGVGDTHLWAARITLPGGSAYRILFS